nr:unnamed protein product [Digitaria exilis]
MTTRQAAVTSTTTVGWPCPRPRPPGIAFSLGSFVSPAADAMRPSDPANRRASPSGGAHDSDTGGGSRPAGT